MKPAKKSAKRPAGAAPAPAKKARGFTDEERDAMRERARELNADAGRAGRAERPDGEGELLAKIAAMEQPDRSLGERLHAIIRAHAPHLSPRTWYGMPAYAREGDVVCFFQSARKFRTRYATLGFSDKAKLDESRMWPTAFALREITAAEEARIVALLDKTLG